MEKSCHCALNRIFGFKPKIGLALISHFGSASEVFRTSVKELEALLGPHSGLTGMISSRAADEAAEELARLEVMNIRFVGWNEEDYPALLHECEDAPIGLYVKSTTSAKELWSQRRRIAVVGTRHPTPYGKEWCERIVSGLSSSPEKPVIVSGLALGTDICAHRTALENGLPTIACMATGPESVYPHRHREFAERLRIQIENSSCPWENGGLRITMSFGVVEVHAEQPMEKDIEEADRKLYVAKKNGRNQVVC